MTVKNYIRNKNKKVSHFNVSGVEVFVKDPITNSLNPKKVISDVFSVIPNHLLSNVDSIYIGKFDFLNKRHVQAFYENSSIFMTNEQDSEADMADDLFHEIAHSVEDRYTQEIYADQKIESEFLQKRKTAWMLLKDQGYEAELQDFLNVDFSHEFDEYLYLEIGYPALTMITANIFYSPYGMTSLREYFANGFEAFFMNEDVDRLKRISPTLYLKITSLLSNQDF